jgi:RNA polymerase sigma-70 factor (sigma-E family)
MSLVDPHAPTAAESAATGAVTALFTAHRMDLIRLAVFLTDDRALAEDLVQDAFAALHRRWASVREPAAAIGYLRTTVVNGARASYRRKALVRRHLRVAEPDAGPAADYALLLSEEHKAVIEGLRRLPRRQREVLVLRYWSGMSEAEIAATLSISRGTVKSTAARGLDALERALKEDS